MLYVVIVRRHCTKSYRQLKIIYFFLAFVDEDMQDNIFLKKKEIPANWKALSGVYLNMPRDSRSHANGLFGG